MRSSCVARISVYHLGNNVPLHLHLIVFEAEMRYSKQVGAETEKGVWCGNLEMWCQVLDSWIFRSTYSPIVYMVTPIFTPTPQRLFSFERKCKLWLTLNKLWQD